MYRSIALTISLACILLVSCKKATNVNLHFINYLDSSIIVKVYHKYPTAGVTETTIDSAARDAVYYFTVEGEFNRNLEITDIIDSVTVITSSGRKSVYNYGDTDFWEKNVVRRDQFMSFLTTVLPEHFK